MNKYQRVSPGMYRDGKGNLTRSAQPPAAPQLRRPPPSDVRGQPVRQAQPKPMQRPMAQPVQWGGQQPMGRPEPLQTMQQPMGRPEMMQQMPQGGSPFAAATAAQAQGGMQYPMANMNMPQPGQIGIQPLQGRSMSPQAQQQAYQIAMQKLQPGDPTMTQALQSRGAPRRPGVR